MIKYKSMFFDYIYSPNESAWYAEIITASGITIHTTGLCMNQMQAESAAKCYIDDIQGKSSKIAKRLWNAVK